MYRLSIYYQQIIGNVDLFRKTFFGASPTESISVYFKFTDLDQNNLYFLIITSSYD